MKLVADYHTHSVYSRNNHGKSTIEENVKVAMMRGLKTIGISDHGMGHFLFGIKRSKLPMIRSEIDNLNEKYPDIEILLGVEANILSFDGRIDVLESEKKYFDYINLGYHSGVLFKNVRDYFHFFIKNPFSKMIPRMRERVIDMNTNALIKAMQENDIKIITHPGAKIEIDIDKLSKEAAKTNTVLEINNYHGHLTVEEIKIAKKNHVLFSLGSDAHEKEFVGRVGNSIERAKKSGLKTSQIINVESEKSYGQTKDK